MSEVETEAREPDAGAPGDEASAGSGVAGARAEDAPSVARETQAPGGAPAPLPDGAASAADAGGPGYRVQLPAFEGPLDLLLHLIQKHELDILDIPIGFVTEKYVEFILLMDEMNIDIASEYLVMAATLAHIKSKMLLPTPPEDQDQLEEDQEDPRAELVRRLLEYQKYRLAAEQLGTRAVLGRDVFVRGTSEAVAEGPAPLASMSVFKLLEAFESILKKVQRTQQHEIDFERISITERINQLADILRAHPSVGFEALFAGARSRADVIVTFLALLEMTRLRMTRISQDSPYAEIHIELAVREDGDEEAPPLAADVAAGQAPPAASPASAETEASAAVPAPAPAVESRGEDDEYAVDASSPSNVEGSAAPVEGVGPSEPPVGREGPAREQADHAEPVEGAERPTDDAETTES